MSRAPGLFVARPGRADERGQMLIFFVGLVLLVMSALALGWDTSNWLIGRRELNAFADGAALAATSDLDTAGYYAASGDGLAVVRADARATVTEYTGTSRITGLTATVDATEDDQGRPQVTVRAGAPPRTTFLHLAGVVAPTMQAESTAVADLREPS